MCVCDLYILPPSLPPSLFVPHSLLVLNKFRKQRLHKTANLITGESDIAPGSIKVSYMHFTLILMIGVILFFWG